MLIAVKVSESKSVEAEAAASERCLKKLFNFAPQFFLVRRAVFRQTPPPLKRISLVLISFGAKFFSRRTSSTVRRKAKRCFAAPLAVG